MAALSDGDASRPRPDSVRRTGLLEILDQNHGQPRTIAHMTDPGGRYLTWVGARATLGRTGDTLLFLLHQTGELATYTIGLDGHPTSLWGAQLPRYFDAPGAREEIRSLPWITVRGDFLKVFDVPHIAAATFAPNGDIYAVRNYSAVWQRQADKVFETQGNWRVESRGLEVYDRRGRLLRAYQLPAGNATVIASDGRGRVVMALGDSTLVAHETSSPSVCPRLPSRIVVAATDEPPP